MIQKRKNKNNAQNTLLPEISNKLDVIIRLLGHQVSAQHETLETKASALKSMGLTSSEIAKICETTTGTISVRLTEAKKKKKKKKKKD